MIQDPYNRPNPSMAHIADALRNIEKTIVLKGADDASRQGFTQIPNSILRESKLSSGAKVVYGLLLSYAWHNDYSFPGQKRLAADMGYNEKSGDRQVRNHLAELKKHSYLTIKQRGQGKTSIYTLNLRVGKTRKAA